MRNENTPRSKNLAQAPVIYQLPSQIYRLTSFLFHVGPYGNKYEF